MQRQAPPRLNFAPHMSAMQGGFPQAMFSPAVGAGTPGGFGAPGMVPNMPFHPGMNMNNLPLQTPVNMNFIPPPLAPGRPGPGHRTRSSIAIGSNGPFQPQQQQPFTPLGAAFPGPFPGPGPMPMGRPGHGVHPSMSMAFGPQTPGMGPPQMGMGAPGMPGGGFVPRSRRTMSVGGPPKAVLGGPKPREPPQVANAVAGSVVGTPAVGTPATTGATGSSTTVAAKIAETAAPAVPAGPPMLNGKKVIIKMPKETVTVESTERAEEGGHGDASKEVITSRPSWARNPLPQPVDDLPSNWEGLEITSSESITVEIVGPPLVLIKPKRAWDALKQHAIEAKLEKLGVEKGANVNMNGPMMSSVPHIFAPHARAASISSPADPALLHWRLNKLQTQSSLNPNMGASGTLSLIPSPHPPHSSSLSPSISNIVTTASATAPAPVPQPPQIQLDASGEPILGGLTPGPRHRPLPLVTTSAFAAPAFTPRGMNMAPNSHAHSMSLASGAGNRAGAFGGFGSGFGTSTGPSTPSFNPFGPFATLGSDDPIPDPPIPAFGMFGSSAPSTSVLHAPHARAAVQMSKLSAPAQGSQSRPGSRPDFVTGFGLDMQEQQAEGGEDQDKGERLEADGDADNGDEEGSEKQEEVLSWAAKVREAEERDDDAFVAAHTVQNGEIVSSGLDGSKDEEDVEVDMDLDVDAAARVVRALEEEGRSQGSRTPTDVEEFEYTDSSFGGMQNGAGIHSEATFGGPGFMGMGGQLGSGISPSMSPLTPRLAGFAQGAGMGLEQIEEEGSMDGVSTAAHSRHHSRHASRLSAALSLRSVGGPVGGSPIASTLAKAQERAEERRRRREEEGMQGMHEYEGMEDVEEGPGVEDGKLHGHGDEEVGDWTGSEDLRDLSDDESIGEWSNPSDEERARTERTLRRLARRALDSPRRLPHFPRPPENAPSFGNLMGEDDIVSNPSDEEYVGTRRLSSSTAFLSPRDRLGFGQQTHHSLGHAHGNSLGGLSAHSMHSIHEEGIPQVHAPHSRTSSQYSYHDPALAHSRAVSNAEMAAAHQAQQAEQAYQERQANLNPFAKPFVFGGAFSMALPTAQSSANREALASPPDSAGYAGANAHSSKTLNVAAPEFRPTFGTAPAASAFASPANAHMNVTAPVFSPISNSFNPAAPVFNPAAPVFNPAAPAFTPGPFNFRMPSEAPSMPVPVAETTPKATTPPRPLPTPPQTVRAQQGREKRVRLGEEADHEGDGNDHMATFRFPSPEKSRTLAVPEPIQRPESEPVSPTKPQHHRQGSSLGASTGAPASLGGGIAMPLALAAFNPTWPAIFNLADEPLVDEPEAFVDVAGGEDDEGNVDSVRTVTQLPNPPQFKPKRAPIPLDFTHPHPDRTNTVPAGLFKALNHGGEDRPRAAARSRLASATSERFDHSHRNSLDDANVFPISLSRKPGHIQDYDEHSLAPPGMGASFSLPQLSPDVTKTFERARRASFPGPGGHSAASSASAITLPPMQVDGRIDLRQLESRLEILLEQKMMGLREDLLEQQSRAGIAMRSAAEAEILLALESVRKQMDDAASKADNSLMDAKGEMDFELIKDLVEQGHTRSNTFMQRQMAAVLATIEGQQQQYGAISNATWQDLSQRTIAMVNEAVNELRQAQATPAATVDVVGELIPHIATLKAEPIDYDFLTYQLSQAVKPHISQLIDLASDKRETAGMIVDLLRPVLTSLREQQPPLDINALASQLTAEVRRVVAPIDAHEIKEQVSDLVVERLDSRLAVRDRAFNAEGIAAKVSEGVHTALQPISGLIEATEKVTVGQQTLANDTQDLLSSHRLLTALISDLPGQLVTATELLKTAEDELRSGKNREEQVQENLASISSLTSAVNGVQASQNNITEQVSELVKLQEDVVSGLNTLPEVLVATTKVLDDAHANMMSREAQYKRDFDEVVQKMSQNGELQTQLAKARGLHGQVRVEKDMLQERLAEVDQERANMKAQVEQLIQERDERTKMLEVEGKRNDEREKEVEEAKRKMQDREEKVQSKEARVAGLEKELKEATALREKFRIQNTALESRVALAEREKAAAEQAMSLMRAEHERLTAGEKQWEELRQVTEQVQALAQTMQQGEKEEIARLRAEVDRMRSIEQDHAALQKRFKDQEGRMANTERAASTARQTLSLAQQRATDAEKRAQEQESEARSLRTKLEEVEAGKGQLETELTDTQAFLEGKETHERSMKDRESKLKDQVAEYEGQVAQLKVQLQQQGSQVVTPAKVAPPRKITVNGSMHAPPARAASPASTISPSRSATPVNGSSPIVGVHASMHAPSPATRHPAHLAKNHPGVIARPNFAQAQSNYSQTASYRPASPALSTVSAAPTLGADGWWE